ncbi:MAG: YbhN family protein [Anaerotardibacter sp.]
MNSNLRKLLIGLVLVIVLAVIFMRGDQLTELFEVLQQGAMIPLVLAICTQLGKYFAQSYAYHFSFRAVHETISPRDTLPLVFGTFFMNTLAPSLNLAGTSLVVDDARRRGIAPGKSVSASLLMQTTVDSGFTIITLLGFTFLLIFCGLSPAWYLLSLLVGCIVGTMILIMVIGSKKPQVLISVLTFFENLVNRILLKLNRKPLNPWAEGTAYSFSQAGSLIWNSPRETLKAFGCSVVASLCELSAFCLVGFAFGVTNIQALICGYVVATLFAMVSITPQGVGVVEAAVLAAFVMFGETAAAGMAIGLVYRSIVFWMPFLIGAVLINFTKTFKGEKAQEQISGNEKNLQAASVSESEDSESLSSDVATSPYDGASVEKESPASDASSIHLSTHPGEPAVVIHVPHAQKATVDKDASSDMHEMYELQETR